VNKQKIGQNTLGGVAVMVLAVFLMTFKDSLAKLTGGAYSPILILWVQFVFMSAVYFPYLVWRYGPEILLPKPFLPQIMRGIAIVIAVSLFYGAIETTPLADATAMAFIAPLVVTAISPVFLGEEVGLRRWSAVIVGFLGVMLILRPDFDGGRLGYLMALGTGFFLGFFYMYNRKLAGSAPLLVSAAYSAYIGAIVLTPVVPFVWSLPQPEDTTIIIWFLIISTVGQTCLTTAFSLGEATFISPFQFAQIIGATLFGYIMFGDFPDRLTWSGIVIVVMCGVYIAVRERKNAPAPALQ